MNKTATLHHSALHSGYVSVKAEEGIKEPYSGRFGEGYTIKRHNPDSTQYCIIEYWIYE